MVEIEQEEAGLTGIKDVAKVRMKVYSMESFNLLRPLQAWLMGRGSPAWLIVDIAVLTRQTGVF